MGTVFSKFHPGDATLHIFWSMLDGFQTFDLLLEKTNKGIRDSWNYVEKGNPPSRRFEGRPEGRQSSEMLPGGLVDRYELVAFLGIQFFDGLSSFAGAVDVLGKAAGYWLRPWNRSSSNDT